MPRALLVLFCVALVSPPAFGQTTFHESAASVPSVGTNDARFRPFDDLFARLLADENIPGASVAVGRNGRVVYARGFGYADRKAGRTVRPNDLFRIASLSKPLTAVAVLQLVEAGKLDLDAPAFALLGYEKPSDPRLSAVTVRQLLHHTGGFDRKASFDPMFRSVEIARARGTTPPATADDVVTYMVGRPLDFDPGTRYAYSNFGYCVLGRIVEKVSGQPYETYVRKQVLEPLGIRSARIGKSPPGDRLRDEVRYFTDDDRTGPSVFAANLGKPVPVQYGGWHLEAMDAHGGWLMSAPDLVRFALAVSDRGRPKWLGWQSVATMFARPTGSVWTEDDGKPSPYYYGCGWSVRPVGSKLNTWHTGSLPGTSSLLVRRHDGLVWAVLFNTRDTTGGKQPATLVDPLMHEAANAVRAWPR